VFSWIPAFAGMTKEPISCHSRGNGNPEQKIANIFGKIPMGKVIEKVRVVNLFEQSKSIEIAGFFTEFIGFIGLLSWPK
jgi:hypothetical protein